jgi:phosphotransferase system enzyme I (PtsI)
VTQAYGLGAAGIGLYRTEFLFLQRANCRTRTNSSRPTATWHGHERAPGDAAHARPGRRQGRQLRRGPGERTQPALGLRGVRLSLARAACSAPSCAPCCAPPATARCASWCRW